MAMKVRTVKKKLVKIINNVDNKKIINNDNFELILTKTKNINLNNDDQNNVIIKENKKELISLINSNTAKNGYKEEEYVSNDLNNSEGLQKVFENFIQKKYTNTFKKYHNNQCKIDINNDENIFIQVKKFKKNQFGQLDRHWIHDITKEIPSMKNIEVILKKLCEYPLKECGKIVDKSKTIKKINISNYTQNEIDKFLENMNKIKKDLLNFAFCGCKDEQPQYFCGVEYDKNNKRNKIIIFNINDVITFLDKFEFKIKKSETVIDLGDCFTLQRKGGDGGKKSSNQLQIKLIFSKLIINNKLEYIF